MKSFFKIFFSIFLLLPLYANEDKTKWLIPKEIPAPKDNQITPKRVELGKFLYFDKRLSLTGDISCASCHHPDLGWSDGKKKAVGIHGKIGPRNSPTVLNTAFQSRQFWDGRAKSLEEQALGPMQADIEMGMTFEKIMERIDANKGYVKLFAEAYPDDLLAIETVAKAIATFERTIISKEAPFDKFIKGDNNAINDEAKKGWELFRGKAKCATCHDGFNFTDGSFHNIALGDDDIGRQALKMKRKAWKGAMKTPTLRYVDQSAPYFHDGSAETLEESIEVCGEGGRDQDDPYRSPDMKDRSLSDKELSQINEFLKTLTGNKLDIIEPENFPQ